MSDLEFGIRVKADASGLVGQLGEGEAALERFERTAGRTGSGAQQLATSTRAAQTELAAQARDAEAAAEGQRRLQASSESSAAAQDQAAAAANRNKAAYQQLGFQLNDIVTQLASGTNPLIVFAQQGSQVAQALSMFSGAGTEAAAAVAKTGESAGEAADPITAMNDALTSAKEAYDGAKTTAAELAGVVGGQTAAENANTTAQGANTTATNANTGATGANTSATGANAAATTAATGAKARFAAMLTGPWGAAIIGGITILGLLAQALFKTEEQEEKTAAATDFYKMSLDDLSKAIEDNNRLLEDRLKTGREAEEQALAEAFAIQVVVEQRRRDAIATIEQTRELIKLNQERTRVAANDPRIAGPLAAESAAAQSRLDQADKDLRRLNAELDQARRGVTSATVPLLQRQARAQTDPSARIQEDYDRALERATAQLRERTEAGVSATEAQREYVRALRNASTERQRREEALRESRRQPRREREVSVADQLESEFGRQLLAAAQQYQGLGVRNQPAELQRLMGMDPRTAAWCAAFLNALLEQQGVQGTGSLRARSFLNWGQEVSNPQAGDVVVLRDQVEGRNSPDHGHVTLFQGFDARGNIIGFGGNQSGKVKSSTYERADVLGFRRAPSGADQYQAELRQAQEAARLADWGERAAQTLGGMLGRHGNAPPALAAMQEGLAQLDALLADIEERRPPNYDELVEQARAARPVIEESINRPYQDFIIAQQDSLELMRLEAQGRSDEAEARRIILQLEREMGPLGDRRKEAVLATVQALQAEQRQIEINQEQQQKYLAAIESTRSLISDTIADVLSGDMEALADLPSQVARQFNRLVGEYLTESLFGDTFRQLEDQVTGTRIVEESSERMSSAVDEVNEDLERFAEAVTRAAAATERAEAAARAGDPLDGFGQRLADGIVGSVSNLDFGSLIATALGEAVEGDEIVVTAQLPPEAAAALADPKDGLTSGYPRDPRAFFQNMLGDLLEDVFGPKFAKLVSKGVSAGLEGAAYGSMVAGVLRSAGVQVDNTGAALGGAAGNILGTVFKETITATFGKSIGSAAGPIGAVIGSLAGGLLGSLISGPQKASATISSADGPLAITGKSGLKGAAGSLGEAVQKGIAQIAEALGGQLGAFSVSIGKRGDSFRVDPLGRGQTKASGVLAFDNEEDAIAAAIADAIKDGAVSGLSQAVQRALRSSSDIDKALREAMKVNEVEQWLQGAAGELNKLFRDFERQAAERVRIARAYGFDLVKIEELNAKERAALVEEALESRVGRLQDLLDDLKFGDLFEGSVVDRRQKLLAEIAAEEAKAKAGEDGAADRVAELRRELIELTRAGFGTAGGEFAQDRNSTIAAAEEIIRLENERVKAAQDAAIGTDQKLGINNQLTNETNNILAEQLAVLRGLGGGGAAAQPPIIFGSGGNPSTARDVHLR